MTKTAVIDFQYAYDCATLVHTAEKLQTSLDLLTEAYQSLGLSINIRKTKIEGPPDIKISGTTLEVVEQFPYLGSHLSKKAAYEAEIQHRASTSFRKLRNRVFDNHNLRKDTKEMISKPFVLPLYGSEAWVTYRCHLKTVEKFHRRCLRKILCIRWQDRLMEANITSIEAVVMQNQLRWAGHCIRMSGKCLPTSRDAFCTTNTLCKNTWWPEKKIQRHC